MDLKEGGELFCLSKTGSRLHNLPALIAKSLSPINTRRDLGVTSTATFADVSQ